MRPVYLSARPHFRATPFRDNRWAVDFRAEVDDMRLGGTGEVRLRVWTDLLGRMDREPEISWDRMPTLADGGTPTPETPLAELHGEAQYAEIADVVLTPEGRRVLDRAAASPQPSADTV